MVVDGMQVGIREIVQQFCDLPTDRSSSALQYAAVKKLIFPCEKDKKAIVVTKKPFSLKFIIPPFKTMRILDCGSDVVAAVRRYFFDKLNCRRVV